MTDLSSGKGYSMVLDLVTGWVLLALKVTLHRVLLRPFIVEL